MSLKNLHFDNTNYKTTDEIFVNTNFGQKNLHNFKHKNESFKTIEFFTLLHVIDGKGSFKLDLQNYELKPNSIYFSYPGQLISKIDIAFLNGYIIYASSEFMFKANPQLLDMSLFQLYGQSHYLNLSEIEHQKLLTINDNISEEIKSELYRKQDILSCLVNLHIYNTDRSFHNHYRLKEEQLHQKVRMFFAILNIDNNINLKANDYALKLNVSPNYLNKLVKEHTGKSLKNIIKERTIHRACIYLLHTNKSIKEIAYELKFNYPQYFNRDFKNTMGMTPVAYRILNS